MSIRRLAAAAAALFVCPIACPVVAQTLSLSSATASATGAASLNLSLSSSSTQPAALQWTFQYPQAGLSNLSVTAGPALAAASKSLSCVSASGSYTCIASGMNSTAIGNGVVAVLGATASQTAAVSVANPVASSAAGDSLSVSAAGGTVTVPTAAPVTLSGLACNPTSLTGASSSSCTVTLSGAATSAVSVALSSSSSSVVVPQSVTVLSGASTAQFSAVNSSAQNATVTLTAALSGVSKTATLALTTSTFSLRVNAGGMPYVDAQGYTWDPDTGFTGGSDGFSTTATIPNTNAAPLYQTMRQGLSAYTFTVPNGAYTVNLKFAEIAFTTVGQRIFSVTLNGTTVLSNFDIVAKAGGPLVPIDEAFPVTVTNGAIQIGFVATAKGTPGINGIEIVSQGAPLSQTSVAPPATFTPLYINSGGSAFQAQGISWSADQLFAGGFSYATTSAISNTETPQLYQTCRYGYQFYYVIPVPNGPYNVTLKFAEVSSTSPGQRVFNAQIDGAPVLTNFDIIAAVGGPNIALDETFPITVTNGVLVLSFSQGPAKAPLVSGIQVAAVH